MYKLRTFVTKGNGVARGFRAVAQGQHHGQALKLQRARWPVNAKFYASAVHAESFLNGSSSVYVEEMYNAWLEDPKSVHKSWDTFFKNASQGAAPGQAYTPPPALATSVSLSAASLPPHAVSQGAIDTKVIDDHLAVQAIIRSYQIRGHRVAQLDPLGISRATVDAHLPADLIAKHYQFGKNFP